ncbi:class II fructose-bisphosphate aldolase [Caproiciproducens sp. NJN-50]|uniref:class II fructose-bisphosphate aldolase n=1 Tax=Acutalibacteraceae TaxID=3082771 RepID=UPI000FFE2624|nr:MULTISPECIES: class II fructose-bisphosphate aldolase [Acutalibacteraceae]QAT50329.1 class II fructose-bisphosphate aldolase [Caproiciproducens sp. NJN-50]
MPLTTSKQMLLDAQRGGYAVGAFNAENMEMVQAIIAAAEELHAPVMIQTTPGTIKYAGLDLYCANVSAAAKNASVPVAMHLDHGNSYDLAVQALRAGYTSIMIDGSKEVLDKNIAITKAVVSACAPCGIPVEGELGKVGGKEDDTESSGTGYTDPDEAVRFVAETGVFSLAVGVGTAHGVYKTKPVLNVELISTLRKVLTVPMVLHGASGLTDEAIRNCVSCGICKVNFATELRVVFSDAVKDYLKQDPGVFDPKRYGAKAREAVKRQVMERMKVCGCDGKA